MKNKLTKCNDGKCPLNRNGIEHNIDDAQIHIGYQIMQDCW